MSLLQITKENFEAEVLSSDIPVLVDFYADWCGPCKMIAPVIHTIAEEHPEIKVCKINVDTEGELAIRYGISSIPSLLVFKGGELVKSSVGAKPKAEILAMMEL